MASKYPKFIALSLVLMLIISGIAYFVMLTAQNYSPLARMKNAQDVAKMSGEYQFRTDIDQVSGYAPSITNYGRESRHDQLVVEGTISESTQTSTMTISNANGVMLEVRRERGQTYARQPGTGWQRTASNSTAQINTLSYLAGMTNAKVVGKDGNSFDFGFDGNAFATHFARLLSADTAHGIKYSDEWYSIAQSNQFKEANGDGNLTLDSDGLPKNMTLNLTMPGNNNNGTVQTSIKTSFFAYARTGLALKKVLNNPFTIVGNLLGTDTSAVKTVLFSLLAVLAVTMIGGLVHLFRRRLYLPVTLLALAMLVFQPFSTIPRSYAATSEESNPTPGPDSTTPSKPEVTFNPLVSPLQQMGSVVLPSAGTTTASDTVVVTGSQSRSLTTRDASSPVTCATLTDSNKNMDADDDGLTNQDECVTFNTLLNDTDSDKDGLNDFAEVQVGTDPNFADSDVDGLNDNVEVTTYTQYGNGPKFYTNPLKADTNGDGVTDGVECNLKLVNQENNCFDANNDSIPDFISFDDDGDGVPDNNDLSPLTFIENDPLYTDKKPFSLNISGMAADKPLTVDIQIRPSNAQLLYTNSAIYDWPSNDTEGQIIRTKDTTYANSDSSNPKPIDAKATNGDMQVTTLLEIKIPISKGNYGGIPVKACPSDFKQSAKLSAIDPNSCVDSEKMTPYGMRAELTQTNKTEYDPTQAIVYVPLSETKDSTDTIVAYNAQLLYLPTKTTTINAQQVRMKWIVSSIQNECPSSKPDCTADEKIDVNSVITSYYSDWKLTGLQTTEDFGTKVAVIYEDGTKPAVTDVDKRRLSIIRTFDLLNNLFVKVPVFNIEGSDNDKSIPVMFDNKMNTNANTTTYGIDKTATKVFTKQYDTMNEVAKLYAEEIPKLLNGVACNNLGSAPCTPTNPQTALTNCKEKTTVQCQPAAITLIESKQRVSSIYDTTDIKIESNTTTDAPTTIRSITGNIYKLNNEGKWQVLTTEELSTDFTQIQSKIDNAQLDALTTRPEKLTDEEWANLKASMTSTRLLSFLTTESGRFIDVPQNADIPDNCYVCVDRVNYFPINKVKQLYAEELTKYSSWTYSHKNELLEYRGEITEFIQQYKEDINNQKANEMLNKANKTMMNAIGKNPIDLQNTIYLDKDANLKVSIKNAWRDVVELINGESMNIHSGKTRGYYLHNLKVLKYSVGSITSLAGTLSGIVSIGVSIGGVANTSLGDAKLGKDLINASYGLSIIATTVQLVNYVRAYKAISLGETAFINASRAVNNGVKTARVAAAEFKALTRTLQNASKISKLAKAFTAVALLATWAIAIFKAVNSEYAYQKGNAIAEAVGQTVAIFILLAISSIPLIGPIITLIIMAIDIIAMAICANVSEKNQRSTAGKWLCGGITGIISNFFTPYAGNVVVDPDDEYSHYRSIKPLLPTISSEFKIDNTITNKIKVIDYIERMPFPSTWMALPYFWQWNGQDEREASFAYALGNQQNDMSYSIATGSQRKDWQSNSVCDTTNSNCEYYANGDKTYTYRKSVIVDYTQQFTQTGINVQMPDMHLSMATKVPLQTCAIVAVIIYPIPACWIETQTFTPKYINLNDTDKTRYDILPATIEKFVEMQPKDSGYTFKWSPLDANPPFPVFKDADNDGLTNEQERIYGTRDNAYDTDGDGISDNREVALTTNPVLKDSDNDGLTDDLELQMGTNPSMPDSDGDGLVDGEEVVRAVKDVNGAITRAGGWEVIYNTAGNSTWISSDPLQADADGDQITDLREKVLGWSPYAKNSGETMTAIGTVREALLPAVQVGFDNNSNPNAVFNSGFLANDVQCVNTYRLTDAADCPSIFKDLSRTLPNSTTMNPYATLNNAQSLDVGNGPQSNFDSQFTIAAWLNPVVWLRPPEWFKQPQFIIKRNGLIDVIYTTPGEVKVVLTTTKGTYTITMANGVLPMGIWKHLAVTYGNQALVVYVDGVEVGRAAVAGNLITTPTQKLIIGNGYFGSIDDIAIYQVALRAGEITQLKDGALTGGNDLVVKPGDRLVTSITQANKLLGRSIQGYSTISGVSGANGFQSDQIKTASLAANTSTSFDSIVTVPGAQNLSTTPSTYANSCVYAGNELCVKFDEALSMPSTPAAATFTDLSTQSNNLTCASTIECPEYKADGSWAFNKNSLKLNTNAAVGNAISAHDFTIAAWVRPEGQPTTLRTIVGSSNTNALMQVALANERPQFSMGSATALVASNALAIGSWSHVLYTFAAGKRSIYVNGVIVATDATAIAYPGSFGVLNVGKDANNNSLNGSLRDLQIYSNALNLRQITALANSCEDPQLIACIPLSGNTSDMSVYGAEQGSVLSNAASNGVLSSSATMPVGYTKLISDHDFTMVAKVKLGSTTANQTIMQTATAVGSGNQLRVATNGASVATLSVGTLSLTAGSALVAGGTYVIAARYQAGLWSLRVDSANGSILRTASTNNPGTTLRQAQEPINIGQSGMTINNIRIYRTAVSDTTLAAVARYALFGMLSVALNNPPVSDQLQISVDARGKVINPDANFERIPGNCDAAVVCLPFASSSSDAPMPRIPAQTINVAGTVTTYPVATQSSNYDYNRVNWTAANIIDGKIDTYSSTTSGLGETNPWVEIDLGSAQPIQNVVVLHTGLEKDRYYNNLSNSGALVFLGNGTTYSNGTTYTSFDKDIATNKLKAVDWKMLGCDNQDTTCTATSNNYAKVSFTANQNGVYPSARYIRIQLNGANKVLALREVTINDNAIRQTTCTVATCPTISNGGANFTTGKRIALNARVSKDTFEGDKEGDKNFTVMTWVRLNAIRGFQAIMYDYVYDGWNASADPLNLGISSGKLIFWNAGSLTGTTSLLPNTWYHVAFVKNGNTRSIYLNGVLEISDTTPQGSGLVSTREKFIGSDAAGGDSLNGIMRDFQIHNTALNINATELTADIAKAATTKSFELRIPFDEPAVASQFSDVLTTGLSLSCLSDCPLSGQPGRDDRAVHFDGAQGLKFNDLTKNYIAYIAGHFADGTGAQASNHTISMWVRPSAYGTWLIGNDSTKSGIRVGIDSSGKLRYEAGKCDTQNCYWPKSPLLSENKLPLNTWSFITLSNLSTVQPTLGSLFSENIYINLNMNNRLYGSSDLLNVNLFDKTSIPSSRSINNIAETFVGNIDELRISPIATTDTSAIQAEMKQAPNWNLTFEDGLYNNRTEIGSDGKSKVVQINAVTLPSDVPGRAGINRFSVAASCDIPEISGVECPVGNTVGMAGTASLFNGKTTMLQVANGTALIDEIKAGGSVQMMIKPDMMTGTQTVLHYGDNSVSPFQVKLVDGRIQVSFEAWIFTATSALLPGWNQISFSFGPTFKYFQNGNPAEFTYNSTDTVPVFRTDQRYKLRIGGKLSGTSVIEMFQGGIDDITFTPSTLAPSKVYRIARSQYSQTMTKTDIASVTIDAEPPVVSITKPNYVARLPQQFVINTSDLSSYVANVTATITSTRDTSGNIINTAQSTAISVPACIDAIGGSAYCPTFGLSQVATVAIEGKYGFITTANDSVGNVGSAQSIILVDTTPPTATLIRPSGTYKTTWGPNQNMPELTIQLSATDPVLTNSGNSPGSGVKSLSVNLKDAAGRVINTEAPIPATLNAGAWTATIPLPFGNPSGFYQVEAIVTDNMGNKSSEIKVADANSTNNPMIEVDASAPRDVITYPSPYNPDNYFVGNQTITGRVSDIGDGRTALQQGLRIRLDFEAPNDAQAFDNRADSRYNSSCSVCPVIAIDSVDTTRRVARFNSNASGQSLTITNAATVLTGTFSIALMAKISDVGTLISTGVASNPRLRIQVNKVGDKFQVTAKKGKASIATPANLSSNTWYYLIYSEYRDGTTSSISLTAGSNLATLTTATATYTGALPPVQPDITIGAMQSAAGNSAKEDFFRGDIDDVLLSPSQLVAADLIGKALAQGSGTQRHLTRLAIDDDGYTGNDRLTDSVDFYMPMNQSSLPIVDAINGIRSSRCTAGTTVAPSTCPILSEGFASNAVWLQRSSDGIKTDYQLQTSASTAKSMSLRFKIGVAATSGLLAWLQAPSTSDSLAMQIGYDKALQSVTVRINDKNATLLATSEATTAINDNDWHAMVITSTGSSTNEQVSVYIDGTLVVTKTIAGHWVNATLGLGALTDVSGYSGRDTATGAAIKTAIDDLAIFSTALTSANINDYSFGYSTVYHETFDDANAGINATTHDDSPYHQPSTITSVDTNLTRVIGTVGTAAIDFDGNDEIVHRDDNLLTFADYNQPWSVSAWITPKTSSNTATIVKGVFNGYAYALSLNEGKPRFTMAGIVLQASAQVVTSRTSHIVISSTGSTATMFVNGINVASVSTSGGSPALNRTATTIPFTFIGQSGTYNNVAGNAYDGDLNTYAEVPNSPDPYWVAINGNDNSLDSINTPIEQITIYSRVEGKPLYNFIVEISKTTGVVQWSKTIPGMVSDHITIPVPNGIRGAQVRIRATGIRSLTINEVQISQLPTITIGTNFNGIIDDVRIYRRALNSDDITRLQAMGWQDSGLTQRIGGHSWQRSQVSNIEANASIQSMTVDNNDNSLVTAGERSLWDGAIDTIPPRITATNVDSNYSVNVSDRNLNAQQMATPCGSKLTFQEKLPTSLWFLQHMSVFDGTYSTPTRFTGTCTLAPYPEVIQTNSQIVSNTNTLVYGNHFAYMGGINQISTLDVKPSTPITQRVTTIAGTVTQLSVNRAKDKLYAISTQNGGSNLTIFDIASSPLIPRQLGTLAITLPTGISIAQMGVAGSATADTYVMLADTNAPANLRSVDVSTATAPKIGAISAISALGSNPTPAIYGMAVQNDIVVLAHGSNGVAIYKINLTPGTSAGASTKTTTYTTGFAQKVFINGNDLLIIDDVTTPPTSPNVLRTINLISGSVSGNTATINSTLTERNSYSHTTPFNNSTTVKYRIIDAVPYRTGELMLLSSATDYPNNQRISIIDTSANTALLKNDTRVNTTSPIRLATNSQNVIALTQQGSTTNLMGYQVSDARLNTSACDYLNNCTTTSSSSSIPITLGLNPPAQSGIRIINSTNAFDSDSQTIHVSAETATAGIATISLLVNGQIVQTHSITGAPRQIEDEFRLENLGSGTYTITTQFTDTQPNPQTITSLPVETVIDLQAPQINVIDTIVRATQIINNMYIVRVVITDDVGVENIQIVNKLTNARIPYTSKKQGNITTASVFYTPQPTDKQGLPLRIIATDRVGNATTREPLVVVDTMPPVTDATISTTVNGKATPLSDEQTITQTNPINVTWTKVSDVSPITLHNLEYAVTTVNGSTTYISTTTVPANSLSIAAGKFPTLTTTEASRVSAKVRLRDDLGNEGATQLPVFYADTPQTPDYTLMNSTEPTYRGFVSNGCAALGEDRRPGLDNIQRFAMTWDSQAIRMNWQGADWEYDGNLFIYLDTIPGGTVQAYRPSNYTQNITDSVTIGESFITLPVNMAARSVAAGSSIASYVNDFQTALTQSQQGIRTSSIQGADYVIAINNRTNARLLTWDGSAWVDKNSPITYQYVNEQGIKQTDIRALFSAIGYTTGNPLGVVAFATKPNSFVPWATFPSSKPMPNDQGNNKFTITPLLNGYGWSNLTSGVCPNTAVLNPDSTQIVASLTSTPNGVFNRALADNFANTDPDAITQIISETAPMCGVLTSDSWCKTVAQYGTINNTGSALLATLAGNLASEQDPVVGNNSVVTYTLKIQNPTNKPTRRMYGIVQTYGGIWLTDSNSSGSPAVAIIGGGNYTYHNVSASGLRDYQLIQFNPIAANSSQTITFRAKIDPTKPQSTTSDRIKTSNIAKVEVRMVDDGTGTSPTNFNVNRTVEWLNAAVAIDTSAPSQVLPDTQTVMTRGAFTITGSVRDQSAVSNVYLEYDTNGNSSSRTQINCGVTSAGQWACPITIPNTATSITYRVRASDVYKQQSQWSGWYGATIDITPPTFVLDPVTTSVSNASYVGGSAISLSGFVTDTTSTANIKVCDQSQALCEFGSTTNPTINQSVTTDTATTATQVTCKNTSTADYTSIPITINIRTYDMRFSQRLSSVTVDVNVTSAAANKLDLWLRSPSGTLTPLMTSLRPSMVNLLARFDDNAINATTSLSGTTDLTGMATAIKPDSALSLLNGETVFGNWQLLACDRDETSTDSVINEWSITLNSSSSVSTNARWSYTLKNTGNQDNVTRKLTLWGVDATNNTSASRIISLNIDTVAPNFAITQLLDTMLSGSNQTAFQGTLSEGGTLSSLSANIYDSKKLVKNIPISVQSMQSQDLSRWNYLLNRTISNYTWQLPIDTDGFFPGTYKIQFIATDVAGNQRTSDAYTILVPEFNAPSITNISTANTFLNTTSTLTYKVDSGRGKADVSTSIALDSAVTAPITDTTLRMWGSSGLADSTAQAKIPASLQNTLISQLEMNNHLAAALDSNGTLTTWTLQNSNTVNVTTPISDVMQLSDVTQFAMGDSSNQHLLTLSNTGIITDYTPTGAASVPITDAVAIAAGTTHNLAIIKTGKLAAWGGSNTNGETTIPANARMGVSQIAAGNGFSMALKSDGRLIAWGKNTVGQITVPVSATTGITQIAAGDNHGLALRADGVVVAWGDNSVGQSTVPTSITDAIFIAANANISAAVTSDGNVYVWGATRSVTNCCAGTSAIALNDTQILTNQVDSTQSQSYPIMPEWNANYYRNQFNGLIPGRRYKYEITIRMAFGTASYTGKFTTNQRYGTLYLPFLTNTDGATTVNTTSGK